MINESLAERRYNALASKARDLQRRIETTPKDSPQRETLIEEFRKVAVEQHAALHDALGLPQ